MATMYDSISVASYPATTTLALAYVDGQWPDAKAVQARFPKARVFTLTTSVAGSDAAEGYDCEKGDGDALTATAWAQRKIAAKVRPLIYCSRIGTAGYGWPWVLANLKAVGVPQSAVDFGIADATGIAHLVPGSVFTQWGQGGKGAYDISMTNGVWPPTAPQPAPPIVQQEVLVPKIVGSPGVAAEYVLWPNGTKSLIDVGTTTAQLLALYGQSEVEMVSAVWLATVKDA